MLSRRRFLQIAAASSGLAVTGADLLSQAVANASPAILANGSRGVSHVVILMMENRSFDHFLGWLPGADGRHDLTFVSAVDGNTYPNYPLAPDFQGCGYSDPDHSWEGWLVQHNYGKLDGFLQRPTTPANNPGVKLAAANTFPIGYYTNFRPDGIRKALPDLQVIGPLAEHYTTLDRYFCAFAGETFPNRFYQHAGQTDRDHNSEVASTLPTIWDQLSPIPNSDGIPTGGYYYRDSPFLALWASPAIEPGATFKYQAFFHPFSDADAATAALSAGTSFVAACQNGTLPNVCYIDPAFDNEATGTSGDDHPQGDIRLGERFIADAYHALADNGYLDNTVFIVTFDEWGGFYDHVPPPQVIDNTNPANVMHAGDSTTPTDGQLLPNYRQLGFRVPATGDKQPRAAAPGRARGPVRALLQPRADRVDLRPAPADRARPARPQPPGRPASLRRAGPRRGAARPPSRPVGCDRPGDQPAVRVAAAGARGHRVLRPGRHLLGRQRAVGVPAPVNLHRGPRPSAVYQA